MSRYVRHSRSGEVRMDFHTFKAIPTNRLWSVLVGSGRRKFIKAHGKVSEFK